MTPEERKALLERMAERQAGRGVAPAATPEEREKRRQLIQKRFEAGLEALRKKEKEGPLTPEEKVRLKRLEQLAENFRKAKTANISPGAIPPPPPGTPPPAGGPRPVAPPEKPKQ